MLRHQKLFGHLFRINTVLKLFHSLVIVVCVGRCFPVLLNLLLSDLFLLL